ncbi:MAG TPA: hypothetical protein PLT47_01495 [Bacteroidales bacterium]|nr:hypothetical protein [Bacteroidales bacterium]HQI69396.1 hypothetical protein [Bacteroidales bacterium]
MKKIFLLLAILSLASCTTIKKGTPVTPMNLQVNLNMDDLQYIGEATGTSTQNYLLGIPYGGRKHRTAVAKISSLNISGLWNRGFNNAMYDALKSQPDADFVIPISFEETRDQMFLGSKRTLVIKTKAFKIKTK